MFNNLLYLLYFFDYENSSPHKIYQLLEKIIKKLQLNSMEYNPDLDKPKPNRIFLKGFNISLLF